MISHSRFTINSEMQAVCFGSVAITHEDDRQVTRLIHQSADTNAQPTSAMLETARGFVAKYPEYLCANFAEAVLLSAGAGRYKEVGVPLQRAWQIGLDLTSLAGHRTLRYSASQGNASFLTAGAMLSQFKVWKSDLAGASAILEQVISMDVERATSARFVQAHIGQLAGKKNAIEGLKGVATVEDPMAFYALGLEQLRLRRGREAQASFAKAISLAPAVYEILLGTTGTNQRQSKSASRAALQYVETFCISEWTGSELSLLENVAALEQPGAVH